MSDANWAQQAAAALSRKHDAAREEACEKALQTGVCGVRIIWSGTDATYEVTHEVPYGEIHEYPNGRDGGRA